MSTGDERKYDLTLAEKWNAGLPTTTGTIPNVEAFGDSGDVFDHELWRHAFVTLSSTSAVARQVVGLASQMLLRARQEKIENKGRAKTYSIDLDGVPDKILAEFNLTGKKLFSFSIIFADETTRVSKDCLTIERFKCAVREVVVPKMAIVDRYPAVSCSIGFDSLVRDLGIVEVEYYTHDTKQPEYAINLENKKFDRNMIADWTLLFDVANRENVLNWMAKSAGISASISQKEIYQECEDAYPGTIFWAGIHCIMTDVSNKRKSKEVTSDLRARFEKSNFYGDFRKKQLARGLQIVSSVAYLSCLEAIIPLICKYLKSTTGITEKEANIINMIMRDIDRKFDNIQVTKPKILLKPSPSAPQGIDSQEENRIKQALNQTANISGENQFTLTLPMGEKNGTG